MTKFKYEWHEKGITIQTDTYCHYFDCARTAADVAFALLQGESTDDLQQNELHPIIYDADGDQTDLLEIVKDWSNCKDDAWSLFASVFFEEVMLLFLVNGKL